MLIILHWILLDMTQLHWESNYLEAETQLERAMFLRIWSLWEDDNLEEGRSFFEQKAFLKGIWITFFGISISMKSLKSSWKVENFMRLEPMAAEIWCTQLTTSPQKTKCILKIWKMIKNQNPRKMCPYNIVNIKFRETRANGCGEDMMFLSWASAEQKVSVFFLI